MERNCTRIKEIFKKEKKYAWMASCCTCMQSKEGHTEAKKRKKKNKNQEDSDEASTSH